MKDEQKQLVVMVVVSMLALIGGQYLVSWWQGPVQESSCAQDSGQQTPSERATPVHPIEPENMVASAPKPSLNNLEPAAQPPQPLDHVLASSQANRIPVETPTLRGSLNLRGGGTLDDMLLSNYAMSIQDGSPSVRLLAPLETSDAYTVSWAWHVGPENARFTLPPEEAVWRVESGRKLAPESPVTLIWENAFVRFRRTFRVDTKGMFFVTSSVTNKGADATMLTLSSRVRRAKPQLENQMMAHEGPIGYLSGALKTVSYDKLASEKRLETQAEQGSWLGVTDKYWLVALAPKEAFQSTIRNLGGRVPVRVSADMDSVTVQPGETQTIESRAYVGAKVLSVLDGYEESQNLRHFDLAVDFGWFYLLTKPTFYVLSWLKSLGGSFAVALLLFTLLLKIFFFPFAQKSYHAMARMKMLTPKLEEVKKRYKDEPQKMSSEVMALYKREKVNPVSGCLPMLLQMPFFFALYKVLSVSIEMRHAPFWGWIHDLAAPDPTNIFNLFGLIPVAMPSMLQMGLWPLLMGLSMYAQQRMSPPPADPAQRAMMLYGMPVIFTYMMSSMSAGLLIFWTLSNVLSIAQQAWITRQDLRAAR